MKIFELLLEKNASQLETEIASLRKEKDELLKKSSSFVQSGVAPQFKDRFERLRSAIKAKQQELNALKGTEEAKGEHLAWRKKEQERMVSPEYKAAQEKKKEFGKAVKLGMDYWKELRDQYGNDEAIEKAFFKKAMQLTNDGKNKLDVGKLAAAFDVPERTMYKWLEHKGILQSIRKLMHRG